IRPSTIADPFYGYDRNTGEEVILSAPHSIGVQAEDNLPCEHPKDASKDFGRALIDKVIPHLIGTDEDQVIARASETTLDGELTEHFAYLEDYLNG
ncbi:MAG: alanine dehydrogenase, partial [Flavobacteriales bacterium]|nr:alanine dehydrogenase [Flavobacteriales bacterium]